jgi:hypothetical protein
MYNYIVSYFYSVLVYSRHESIVICIIIIGGSYTPLIGLGLGKLYVIYPALILALMPMLCISFMYCNAARMLIRIW